MSRVSRTTSSAERPRPRWLLPASALIAVVAVLAAVGLFFYAPRGNAPVAWAKLATEDVHSLSFVGADLDHLLFGHHGGLLESRDGGRTWRSLPTTVDAMSMRPAADGSLIIAGHEVFTASVDGGQTWQPIRSDLPSLDIHGFTRAPGDPARMWAYLATGGLWASEDTGGHWTRVRQDNVLFPTAVQNGNATRLFGIDMSGFGYDNLNWPHLRGI